MTKSASIDGLIFIVLCELVDFSSDLYYRYEENSVDITEMVL